jgi:hypothetical protein
MSSIKGLSAEQLKAKINELKAQGKTESNSKEVGKYVNALKVLEPTKYRASDVESAKTSLLSSTTPETQAQLGIGTGTTTSLSGLSLGTSSSVDLNKIYETALNDPALVALEEELNAKKTARDTAESDINDNPYYSEATRVGKISKLDQKALNEINTLQSQIDAKKADAQVKVNIAAQQYNIDDKEYQNNIQKLNLLISSGAISGATSSDISQIALATGMSTDMINAIIQKAKQGDVQTSVQTNTDDNGNVTVSVINTKTGEIVAQNSLGQVDKTKTDTSTPNTNKYLTTATKYLAEADIQTAGTEDKLLSRQEQTDAYNRILALVGGDTALAQQVFQQAWSTGGYGNWGE